MFFVPFHNHPSSSCVFSDQAIHKSIRLDFVQKKRREIVLILKSNWSGWMKELFLPVPGPWTFRFTFTRVTLSKALVSHWKWIVFTTSRFEQSIEIFVGRNVCKWLEPTTRIWSINTLSRIQQTARRFSSSSMASDLAKISVAPTEFIDSFDLWHNADDIRCNEVSDRCPISRPFWMKSWL